MTARFALGIGFRAAATCAEIVAAVEAACRACGQVAGGVAGEGTGGAAGLGTHAEKAEAPALVAAAAQLGLIRVGFGADALRAVAERTLTPSPASAARFGTPSVAEAAALALLGPAARLAGPRLSTGGVTVAIALLDELAGESREGSQDREKG